MRKKSALLAGIIAGISSPASIYATPSYPRINGDDLGRMRGDVRRIGNDFRVVIRAQYDKTKKPATTEK